MNVVYDDENNIIIIKIIIILLLIKIVAVAYFQYIRLILIRVLK